MTDLPERICAYLNGFGGRICDLVPETMSDVNPCGGMFMKSAVKTRKYVDGSAVSEIPFEIRVRTDGVTVREKLDVHEYFAAISAYVKDNPMAGDGICGMEPVGGGERCAVLPGGDEEYRMEFVVSVKK
ncbi:MAG: hypothetical protein E7638_05865 [Ruminococcaceae bacterium]|nr:hypothetical protein [Oscillospiraceae bacterium]